MSSQPPPVAEEKAESKSNGKRKALVGRYLLGRELGRGVFGVVHAATDVQTMERVALKLIPKVSTPGVPVDFAAVRIEIRLLMSMRHANIVRGIRCGKSDPRYIALAMELVRGAELYDVLVGATCMNELEAHHIFKQIVLAVEYLHSHNIVHRDLKLENIIVTDTLHVKLIDFGLATYGKASKRMRTLCGSKHTIAPEIVRGETYDKKCDCWSIGVILYCLTSGFQPFEGDNDLALWKHISLAKCYFPHFLSSELRNLLKRLLDGNPSTRASAVDALEHEWTVACEQTILKKGLEGARAPPAFRIDDARRHNMAFLETARRVHAAKIKLAPQLRGNSDLETDLDDKEDLRDILDDSPPRTPAPSRPSSPATVHSSCSDSDSPPPRRHNETRAPLHRPVPLKPKCSSRVPVKTLHSEPARRHHSRPSFFPPIRPSSADGKVAAHAARHHQLKKGSDVGNNVSARNPNGKARKLCKLMNGLAVQHGTASRSSSGSGSHDKRNSRRPPTRQRTSRPPSRLSRLRGKEKKETKLWSPAHSPVRGLSPLGNKRPASTHPTTSPRRGSSRKKRAAMAIRGSKMINSAKIAAQRVSDPMAQRQPAPSIPPKTGSCRMQAVRANGSDQTAKNAAAVRPALPRRSRLSRWKVGHAKKALIRTLTPPLPRQK